MRLSPRPDRFDPERNTWTVWEGFTRRNGGVSFRVSFPSTRSRMRRDLEQVLLADCGTFRLGGPCRRLIDCEDAESLEAAVRELEAAREEFILIGGGSNILFSDAGWPGTVVRLFSPKASITVNREYIEIPAGMDLDRAVLQSIEAGRDGLVACSGIPGTVGGAIVGNAGAWGEQISDRLLEVERLRRDGSRDWVAREGLGFRYRHSRLKESGELVLRGRFALPPGDPETMMLRRHEILALRAKKHPNLDTHPCIGSFFRNLEPSSAAERRQAAGWFLEQAGAKSLKVGGARPFEKHANIIVKGAGCLAQDVHDLHELMKQAVEKRFGIKLVREIRFLGEFKGVASHSGFW